MKTKKILCVLLAGIMIAMLAVIILPATADNTSAEIIGDSSKLHIEKNVFYDDEPIMVSAVGKGKDWIGLVQGNNSYSMFYYYIDKSQNGGVGSGVTFNLLKSPKDSTDGCITLTPGKYKIVLYPNDQTVSGGTPVAYANIIVKERPGTTPKVVKSAKYELANNTDGYAKGKITVETDEDQIKRVDIIMYWGNEKGKLPGYKSLARFRVTGIKTETEIPDGVIIPAGATKLLFYSRSKTGKDTTSECYAIDLPEGAASKEYGKPLFSYSVSSDIHITSDNNYINNRHFKKMVQDVTKIRPDSKGNIFVGDIADSGQFAEMMNMKNIYDSVEGVAPRYICAGNHDMRDRTSIADKTKMFNRFMKLPNGDPIEHLYYDFWLEGYHFIFLGPDVTTNNDYVMMSRDELKWLDKTLAENYDPNRPAFIFLHQPLPNTVIGSLENKYGQGWANIDERCVNQYRKILEKYPEAIMFNGHTHGILSSESNIFISDELPTIINTASVAYEWDWFDSKTYGGNAKGSEGYIVDVYPERIVVKGRNFESGEWVPSAQYVLKYKDDAPVNPPIETETDAPVETPVETPAETPAQTPAETPAETPKDTQASTNSDTDSETEAKGNEKKSNTIEVVLIVVAVVVIGGVVFAAVAISKKH